LNLKANLANQHLLEQLVHIKAMVGLGNVDN
jgi:hypothetical protein